MREVIYEMSRKGLGMTCVVDGGRAAGGHHHRRRPAAAHGHAADVLARTAADVMTPRPGPSAGPLLAVEALKIIEERKISSLIVVDAESRVRGRAAPARPVAHGDVLIPCRAAESNGRARAPCGCCFRRGRRPHRRHDRSCTATAPNRRRFDPRLARPRRCPRAGLVTGVLSARASAATTQPRAAAGHGASSCSGVHDKLGVYERILATSAGSSMPRSRYMGDDLLDLPVLQRVGLAARPPTPRPRCASGWTGVSAAPGGRGAVREPDRVRAARAATLGGRRAPATRGPRQ